MEPGIDLEEITVKAPFYSEKEFGANLLEIPVHQLKQMPALLGEVDLLKAYQSLPGIQGGSEGKSGLFVRGGGPGQNLITLDGSPLYYVNHLGGFASIFDPEAINNFKLYKGGFPARFGGRLSSVLDVQMKEGDKNNKHTFVSIGLLSGRFSQQAPVFNGKGSYFISIRRMWIDLLTRPLSYLAFNGASIGYNFYDINSKITYQLNEKNKVYFSLYSGDDRLALTYKKSFLGPDIKSKQKIKWGNLLGVVRLNHQFNPDFIGDVKISFTKYRFKDVDSYNDKNKNTELDSYFKSRIYDYSINSQFEYFVTNSYKLFAGAGIIFHSFEPGLNRATNINNGQSYIDSIYGSTSVNAVEQNLFLENQFYFNNLNLNIGGRINQFIINGKNYRFFEPRLSAGLKIYRSLYLKSSYTKMHQFVNMLSNPTAGFSTDFWVPATQYIPPGSSRQYALGVEKTNQNYEISLEAYLKDLNNLIAFKEGEVFQGSAVDWQHRIEKNGVGKSKGLEFFLHKKSGKFTGWMSYTLAKSDRQFKNINFGKKYPYKYDRRHDFNFVISFPLNDMWKFSASWMYGSGYPITLALGKMNVVSVDEFPLNSNNHYSFNEYGEYYGDKNSFRMKDYHRLDIGFTHTTEKYGVERIWTIGIYNAYNRQNPYYYFYKQRQPWNGDYTTELYQSSFLPIIPAISYSIRF
jgi:hypothetical protein